jgi:hypothetical protein
VISFPTNAKLRLPRTVENDIRGLLNSAEHQLSLLEEEISRLLEERKQFNELINRLRISIAPHKNLHPELLSLIFLSALPEYFPVRIPLRAEAEPPRNSGQDILSAPWQLSHVCKSWRVAALGEPALWSSVYVHQPQIHHREALACVLTRSGTWSLRLKVDLSGSSSFSTISDLIMPHASRISQLDLSARYEDLLHCFDVFSTPSAALSSLQGFYIRGILEDINGINILPRGTDALNFLVQACANSHLICTGQPSTSPGSSFTLSAFLSARLSNLI